MPHECWEVYRHPEYSEYGHDIGPVAASPTPAADGVAMIRDSTALLPRPDLGFRPSPDAGKYLAPDVGNVPGGGDAAGLGPASPGADTPGLAGLGPAARAASSGDTLGAGRVGSKLPPLAPGAASSPLSCGPNPITSSARITFTLEAPGAVRLAVYDLAGRRVATLAEGRYDAGEHAVTWRADVPTGVYIYRLEAGAKVATRKLVVAK
jgi:hypothetical protein